MVLEAGYFKELGLAASELSDENDKKPFAYFFSHWRWFFVYALKTEHNKTFTKIRRLQLLKVAKSNIAFVDPNLIALHIAQMLLKFAWILRGERTNVARVVGVTFLAGLFQAQLLLILKLLIFVLSRRRLALTDCTDLTQLDPPRWVCRR